jgi:hypothetical protein
MVGVPFSAVGTLQTIRRSLDGTQFVQNKTKRYYRDAQGDTRLEWEVDVGSPIQVVTIQDRASGEAIILSPLAKTANIVKRSYQSRTESGASIPAVTVTYNGVFFGPNNRAWSAPVSLGEKSIEGFNAVGTRRVCTIAPGVTHNDKAVTVTVEEWFSPALGLLLAKTTKATTGSETHYNLGQIVQAEPDASLFKVPSDYKQTSLSAPAEMSAGTPQ